MDPTRVHDLDFVQADIGRELRQGLPEVVHGPGKTPAQICAIVTELLLANTGPVLVTRVDAVTAADVLGHVPGGSFDVLAGLLVWRPAAPNGFALTVVSGGTSDWAVATEAAAVAKAVGLVVTALHDVGAAGLHSVLRLQEQLRDSDAVVVLAGMEGALASVVGGLVGCPVIAVPVSTGYGASLEGVTALLAMHASCAAGLTVVNIDSGFGAAMAAHRLAWARSRRS